MMPHGSEAGLRTGKSDEGRNFQGPAAPVLAAAAEGGRVSLGLRASKPVQFGGQDSVVAQQAVVQYDSVEK